MQTADDQISTIKAALKSISLTPDARIDFDTPQKPDEEFTYDYVPMTRKDLEVVG